MCRGRAGNGRAGVGSERARAGGGTSAQGKVEAQARRGSSRRQCTDDARGASEKRKREEGEVRKDENTRNGIVP